MSAWTVAEAKAKFSEVIELARKAGPQTITRNGKRAVMIVDVGEWERRAERNGDLASFLIGSPLHGSGVCPTRLKDGPREIDL